MSKKDKPLPIITNIQDPYEVDRELILNRLRETLKEYLYSKYIVEDWHGVCDAANELREVEAELKGLKDATS